MKGAVVDDVALYMTDADNVVTALDDLDAGDALTVDGTTVALAESIPFGHKIAVEELAAGTDVVKYGEVIGRATESVMPGEWVHTHNCESNRGRGDLVRTDA